MMRCYVVIILVIGFSSLTACVGASNGAFAPTSSSNERSALERHAALQLRPPAPNAEFPAAGPLARKEGRVLRNQLRWQRRLRDHLQNTTAGKERVLHNFQGTPDGANPVSTLIMDKEEARSTVRLRRAATAAVLLAPTTTVAAPFSSSHRKSGAGAERHYI